MIVQGDNGIVVPFVTKKDTILNLENSTVEVSVKRGEELLTKTATIINAATGRCQFELSSLDLTIPGTYEYQWTATYQDGRKLSGRKQGVYVSEKLAGTAPETVIVDGGTF